MRKLPHRRAFILLFGTRNLISNGLADPIEARCPRCGANVKLIEKFVRPWFTMFFLPVFPVGKARPFTQCTNCNAAFSMPPQQLIDQVMKVDARQSERAIGMYNSLRSSPANSVTLNELMQLYASMNEFDQAISAAADFPQALNNSEQCMTTLGRVLMEQGQHEAAIKWFDVAMQRNPMLGEAAYCKAVALMNLKPPDLTGASTAARAARTAGLPQADALLKDIENRARATQ